MAVRGLTARVRENVEFLAQIFVCVHFLVDQCLLLKVGETPCYTIQYTINGTKK